MSNIALIDDDSIEALILQSFLDLSNADHKMDHYICVKDFIDSLAVQKPDLIFLDRKIPPYSSFEESLIEIVKTSWSGPVILLSASFDGSFTQTFSGLKIIGSYEKTQLMSPESVIAAIDKAFE